jgi:Reverse transcriptase (RNA-dependent DNA polymerase)
LVVLKKDGTSRVVIDYRLINAKSKGQAYTMKDPYELLEQISGHEVISSMDFLWGYHHLPMAEASKELTAFGVPGPGGGQYHFNVMPFGLKGAPATFQKFVDDVFHPYLRLFAVVYIDDLAIYSNS